MYILFQVMGSHSQCWLDKKRRQRQGGQEQSLERQASLDPHQENPEMADPDSVGPRRRGRPGRRRQRNIPVVSEPRTERDSCQKCKKKPRVGTSTLTCFSCLHIFHNRRACTEGAPTQDTGLSNGLFTCNFCEPRERPQRGRRRPNEEVN